jgi:pantothenate kinase-related protein Tda10
MNFEDVCRSFARWIVRQKRLRRPTGLYGVGVNGTIGQGKTVFSQAVARELNALLKPEEGRAVVRSLDDYYLPKADRYQPEFLSRGYHPQGIPNRGPAGTHDPSRLWGDILKMEQSHLSSSPTVIGGGSIDLPSFDKQADDRSPDPFRVEGRVGVFILEGWFVGCRTDADPMRCDPGLKRSVAAALKNYKPVFDRLDALWVFESPRSLEEIVAQRIEQQATLNRETGRTGMTPAQIRRFIDYFYKDSWQEGVTSPEPTREASSFRAATDVRHHFLKITRKLPARS